MKKKLHSMFSLLSMLMVPMGVMADSRTADEAQAEALRFLSPNASGRKSAPARQSLKLSYTLQQLNASKEAAYLFQIGENDGFVLVSADDNTQTILGYASEGRFDATNIPDNMQVWLQHYAEEITWASEHGVAPKRSSMASRSPIAPLLGDLVWNQGAPFWNKCPKDADGNSSYTGCVATATAQVMRFWNHPLKGTGSHSYAWENSNGATKTLSANFGATTYDWNNMIPNYNYSYNTTQANAVATLMYHVGVATEMGYSSQGSGTQTESAARSMFTYFGYDKSMYAVRPDFVGFESFGEQMLQELQAGRPVLMSGSTVNYEGHAFVCDGFDGEYFHINWGWGGYQDGYFALSALDPEEQGMGGAASGAGYHVGILGVMGIRPDQGGQEAPVSLGADVLRLNADQTITTSTTFTIYTGNIANIGLQDYAGGAFGLAVFDEEGYFVTWFSAYGSSILPPGYYYGDVTFEGDLSGVADDGQYRILPIYTDEEMYEYWLMEVGFNSPQYISFTKSGNKITFGTVENPDPSLFVSNLAAYADGTTIHFSFLGDAPYYHVKVFNSESVLADDYIDFTEGQLADVPSGKWTVWVCAADEGQNDVGDPVSVSVTVDQDYNVYNLQAYSEGSTIHFSFESNAPKFHVKVYNDTDTYANGIIDFKNASLSNVPDGEWTIWVRPCDEDQKYYLADAVSTTVFVSSSANVPCSSISLDREHLSLYEQEFGNLTAFVSPTNATYQRVLWSSSDESVATVDENGQVFAVSPGEATITARTNDGSNLSASCTVTVWSGTYKIRHFTAYSSGLVLIYSFESEAPYNHVKVFKGEEVLCDEYIDYTGTALSCPSAGEWTVWVCAADEHKNDVGNCLSAVVKVEDVDLSVRNLQTYADGSSIHVSFNCNAPKYRIRVYNESASLVHSVIDVNSLHIRNIPDGEWIVAIAPVEKNEIYVIGEEVTDTVNVKTVFQITYMLESEVYHKDSVKAGSTIQLPDCPEKTGYSFIGWEGLPAHLIMPDNDVTVSGYFQLKSYTVSYFVENIMVHHDTIAYGTPLVLWTYVPADENQTFNGWIGEKYETMPAFNITYVADITTGIENVCDHSEKIQGIYTLDGKKAATAKSGIYVIRKSDGSTQKVVK